MSHTQFDSLLALIARVMFFVRQGVRELGASPIGSALLPSVRMRVHLTEGPPCCVALPAGRVLEQNQQAKPEGDVFVVPESACLYRRLILPMSVAARDESSVVALEVETISPFGVEDTVFGWRTVLAADGRVHIDIAISSRQLVEREAARMSSLTDGQAEVWALPSGSSDLSAAIVLRGFGEPRRVRRLRRRYLGLAAQFVLVCLLSGALAVTPLWHKRQQVVVAQTHHAMLASEVGPVVATRDQLERMRTRYQEISPVLAAEPDFLKQIERISILLPDDAWLGHLEYTGGVLRVVGNASEASALLQAFQREPAFRNVRATSSIVRDPRSGKESFTFEMELGS